MLKYKVNPLRRGNEHKVAVNQTNLHGAPGNRSFFKTTTRKKIKTLHTLSCYHRNRPSMSCFLISFQKFIEDLALKRNAADASSTPKNKSLRSPAPYAQKPRSPSWSRGIKFEYKDNLPVAGELTCHFIS